MERHLPDQALPYVVGALYNRRIHIHERFGGSRQSGITKSSTGNFVFAFTSLSGARHGYMDFWDDAGAFHYFGEGQSGDMELVRGNRAIGFHKKEGRRLLVFQSLGHGAPYRFLGEFQLEVAYKKPNIPDTVGNLRTAIVFKLLPMESSFDPFRKVVGEPGFGALDVALTSREQIVTVRAKQDLFRKNLVLVERECRLSGIADLRFLRASHIKPWARCETGLERVDGHNGLLLSPHADLLFDRGWISFESNGELMVSKELPREVSTRIGLDLKPGRKCGSLSQAQESYMEYHRHAVFEKAFLRKGDPIAELLATVN